MQKPRGKKGGPSEQGELELHSLGAETALWWPGGHRRAKRSVCCERNIRSAPLFFFLSFLSDQGIRACSLPARLSSLIEQVLLSGLTLIVSAEWSRESQGHRQAGSPLSPQRRATRGSCSKDRDLVSGQSKSTYLLGFPPQDHFLLPLLGFQGPDLKLWVREEGRGPHSDTEALSAQTGMGMSWPDLQPEAWMSLTLGESHAAKMLIKWSLEQSCLH